eukprot:5651688-Prymnesium_polylepis.1
MRAKGARVHAVSTHMYHARSDSSPVTRPHAHSKRRRSRVARIQQRQAIVRSRRSRSAARRCSRRIC